VPRTSVEELRRGEIINGAIRLIARDGYEATTMRALAVELEVSTGTITHWFATKNQILGAALEEVAARFARRVDEALAGVEDPREILIAFGEASVPDDPGLLDEQRVWAAIAARAARTPELAERHARLYRSWRRRMERAVEAGIAASVFRSVDPSAWAVTYAGLVDGLALHVLLDPSAVSPARMRAVLRAHVDATLGSPPPQKTLHV
jgi:AcrR family transcriptional regulator